MDVVPFRPALGDLAKVGLRAPRISRTQPDWARQRMTFATVLTRIASELALFSAAGFLLFAINDLLVDAIYFSRRFWRSATVYRRYPRAYGQVLAGHEREQRFLAIFVPAWDEPAVIASMLRATVSR